MASKSIRINPSFARSIERLEGKTDEEQDLECLMHVLEKEPDRKYISFLDKKLPILRPLSDYTDEQKKAGIEKMGTREKFPNFYKRLESKNFSESYDKLRKTAMAYEMLSQAKEDNNRRIRHQQQVRDRRTIVPQKTDRISNVTKGGRVNKKTNVKLSDKYVTSLFK